MAARRHALRRPALLARAAIVAAIRRFFGERGFVEVETPALQVSPGLEPHLAAFETALAEPFDDGTVSPMYLHSSPEFAMKKLLAAGEQKIFQIARCYRNEERSQTHHPEFTMLEWYRAGAAHSALWADCEGLLAAAAEAAGTERLTRAGKSADPRAEWTRVSVCEAFARHAGLDLAATMDDVSDPAPPGRRRARRRRLDRRERQLGGRLLPHLPRQGGAGARHRRAGDPLRLPGLDGGAGAARPRPPLRRALRAVRLRPRARQRLRRAHRPRRNSARASRPTARSGGGSGAAPTRSTRISWPRSNRGCRTAPGSRSGSTAWSCWRSARSASRTCSGRRWPGPAEARPSIRGFAATQDEVCGAMPTSPHPE